MADRLKDENTFREGDDARLAKILAADDMDEDEINELLHQCGIHIDDVRWNQSRNPPEICGFPTELADRVDDLLQLPNNTWSLIHRVGEDDPDGVRRIFDRLMATVQEDDPEAARSAAFAIHIFIPGDSAAFTEFVSELQPALAHSNEEVRDFTCQAVAGVAEEDPQAVLPVYEEVVRRLEDSSSGVRGGAVWTLRHLVEVRPELVWEQLETVADLVDDEYSWTRDGAAWTLVGLGEIDPGRVSPCVPQVIEVLEGYVFRGEEYTFSNLGPDEVLFEGPMEFVRVVGQVDSEVVADAVPVLEEVASEESYDRGIRSLAGEVLIDIKE